MRVGVMMAGRFRKVPEQQPFGDSSQAKVRMRGNGKESGVAKERGSESGGRVKRRRAGQLQSGDWGQPEGSGEVGGQSEAGIVSGADGEHAGTGEG